MDDIFDEISTVAAQCEVAAQPFQSGAVHEQVQCLMDAIDDMNLSWSGSWLGYHSSLYIDGLRPQRPGEHFDTAWGMEYLPFNRTRGPSGDYTYDEIKDAIMSRAGITDLSQIVEAADAARRAIDEAKERLIPLFDALLSAQGDKTIQGLRDDIDKACPLSRETWLRSKMPRQVMSNDRVAMDQFLQGWPPPLHLGLEAWLVSATSCGQQAGQVARFARRTEQYLKQRDRLRRGGHMPQAYRRIFIGYGRSPLWRELQGFIQNRLKMEYDEFNRESTTGLPISERLEIMLDHAGFALLVMTAEDEHADATRHARENVVHEAGLFQGRLGFRRAIILLEEGCAEFSNIVGLSQIRFPKGNIRACFEDVRAVLEREGLL